MTIIELIICIWFIVAMFSPLLHGNAMNKDVYYFFPWVLYRLTTMNWFGCLFVSLLACIVNPFYCSMMIIGWIFYKIYKFVFWILHVGRKF